MNPSRLLVKLITCAGVVGISFFFMSFMSPLAHTTFTDDSPAPDEFIPVEKAAACDMTVLTQHMVYPASAIRKGIEGRVVLRVLIDTIGTCKRVLVEESADPELDSAAVRAILSTEFSPAIQQGKKVQMWVSIPVAFKLKGCGERSKAVFYLSNFMSRLKARCKTVPECSVDMTCEVSDMGSNNVLSLRCTPSLPDSLQRALREAANGAGSLHKCVDGKSMSDTLNLHIELP